MSTIPHPPPLGTGGSGSEIVAQLGPTNTGKTHRAIERMIWHGGGIIGLPLRLLAREVYARVCQAVGEGLVALLTGEERIEPHAARYWVCTVESMPMDRLVPFVAVDEIQLAAHPTRGHVFTDRLLNARGTRETWFMGSDTMRPLIEQLTPTARIESFERLSKLRFSDPRKLDALPRRSAVVAFSVSHVYELAERLRAAQGGVAVVLGALSPRARNAQVELFESGEVNHLVSTDAIGMGLNLDIRHIYFGALRKYDGHEHRLLDPWEMGQIAGRAGRHTRDGHFGLTRACADRERLHPELIRAIEQQRFAPVRRIYYRNSDLAFDSVDALREGLARAPFARCLIHARHQEDAVALEQLLKLPDVADMARGRAQVELLWDVCRVPDYRQDSASAHIRLLAELYRQLADRGRIPPDWLERRLRRLESAEGTIDQMMQRIAHTRTWAYIAHRADWLSDTDTWRQRVLALEEQLSAAIHQRLTEHFVDEWSGVAVTRPVPHDVALDGQQVITRTIPLGTMGDFSFEPDPEARRLFGYEEVRRQGRRACQEEAARLAAELLASPDFEWDEALKICWRGRRVARLTRGPQVDTPQVRATAMDLLDAETRRAIALQAEAWVRAEIDALGKRLIEPRKASGPLRGLLYVLRSRLGVAPRDEVRQQLQGLNDEDRRFMARQQIRVGLKLVFATPLLKSRVQRARAACWAAWLELPQAPELPDSTQAPELDWPEALADAMGYPRVGPRCVRADLFEQVTATLRQATREGPAPLPDEPLSWLGVDRPTWQAMARALGYTLDDQGLLHAPRAARKRRRQR